MTLFGGVLCSTYHGICVFALAGFVVTLTKGNVDPDDTLPLAQWYVVLT